MADQLYLSLWFPNFRLESLPAALNGVLRQFATIARDGEPDSPFGRVFAASAIPLDWTEQPLYQRIYVNDQRAADGPDAEASKIENAVREATEQLHEDTAYEFEMRWNLWQPAGTATIASPSLDDDSDDVEPDFADEFADETEDDLEAPSSPWELAPAKVRIIGFGPQFDAGSFEQNGHIRVDFGLDTPWTFETANSTDEDLETSLPGPGNEFARHQRRAQNRELTARIRQNVEKLLAFTLSVEKHCGISSRLLWTESGEPLAEKLIAQLQRLN